MGQKSNWRGFIEDFGDALGGISIGYAIGTSQIWYGVVGAILVLTSIYTRFYHRKP